MIIVSQEDIFAYNLKKKTSFSFRALKMSTMP